MMHALTQRLLAFSRRQTLDPKPIDINRLAQGMAELIHRTMGPTVRVDMRGEAGLWPSRVGNGLPAPEMEVIAKPVEVAVRAKKIGEMLVR